MSTAHPDPPRDPLLQLLRWLVVGVGLLGVAVRGVAQPEIALEAEASQRIYAENAENTIYVQGRIRVGDAAAVTTPESVRNIALVIDRSGSMAGERIAATRDAISAALGALDDRDVISVVLFGSEIETLIEAQRGDQAREQFSRLGAIEAEGGAALYDGLSQAAALVRRYAGPGTVSELVLINDGPATKGPREPDDFARLVESLAREGMTVSTVGVGDEFDEDLLASLARLGGGRFHFADRPARIVEAVLAEVAPRRTIVARDAVLTFEYKTYCDEVKAHGARHAHIDKNTVIYRFPQLYAGQAVSALASGVLDSFRARIYAQDIVRVRLAWTDAASGEPRQLERSISFSFSGESRVLADTANVAVYRAAVSSLIRDGMQDAIEQLDKGEFRRALRALRRARENAKGANFRLDDPEITAMVRVLEAYISEVQTRGMNQLDRKILRSGLFNQFEVPSADEEGED